MHFSKIYQYLPEKMLDDLTRPICILGAVVAALGMLAASFATRNAASQSQSVPQPFKS